jgi:hypothetical protein
MRVRLSPQSPIWETPLWSARTGSSLGSKSACNAVWIPQQLENYATLISVRTFWNSYVPKPRFAAIAR